MSDIDRNRALDLRLADALLKIVKGDPDRHLAVMSETLAQHGPMLRGRQILFLIYREFEKDTHITDVQSYSHLEKVQGMKGVKGQDLFLAVLDNLMLNL